MHSHGRIPLSCSLSRLLPFESQSQHLTVGKKERMRYVLHDLQKPFVQWTKSEYHRLPFSRRYRTRRWKRQRHMHDIVLAHASPRSLWVISGLDEATYTQANVARRNRVPACVGTGARARHFSIRVVDWYAKSIVRAVRKHFHPEFTLKSVPSTCDWFYVNVR